MRTVTSKFGTFFFQVSVVGDRYCSPSSHVQEQEREETSATGIGAKRAQEECDQSIGKRRRFQSRKSVQFSQTCENDQAQSSTPEVGYGPQ